MRESFKAGELNVFQLIDGKYNLAGCLTKWNAPMSPKMNEMLKRGALGQTYTYWTDDLLMEDEDRKEARSFLCVVLGFFGGV